MKVLYTNFRTRAQKWSSMLSGVAVLATKGDKIERNDTAYHSSDLRFDSAVDFVDCLRMSVRL